MPDAVFLVTHATSTPLANDEDSDDRDDEKQYLEETRPAVGRDAKDLLDEIHGAPSSAIDEVDEARSPICVSVHHETGSVDGNQRQSRFLLGIHQASGA
jgi:hypothetical protein